MIVLTIYLRFNIMIVPTVHIITLKRFHTPRLGRERQARKGQRKRANASVGVKITHVLGR